MFHRLVLAGRVTALSSSQPRRRMLLSSQASLRNFSMLRAPEPPPTENNNISLTRNQCAESAKSFCRGSKTPKILEDQLPVYNLLLKMYKEMEIAEMENLMAYSTRLEVENLEIQASLLNHSTLSMSVFQRCGLSPSASLELTEKETSHTGNEHAESTKASRGMDVPHQTKEAGLADPKAPDQICKSGSDLEDGLIISVDLEDELLTGSHLTDKPPRAIYSFYTIGDVVKKFKGDVRYLKTTWKALKRLNDELISYKNMDYRRQRLENAKKFAIENFAGRLLDFVDNLGTTSAIVKKSFSKIDASKDTAGAVPLLNTLLEAVDTIGKHIAEVFERFQVKKIHPMNNDLFDPHRHNAVFQKPDGSKPSGTIDAVMKEVKTSQRRNVHTESAKASGETEVQDKTREAGSDLEVELCLDDVKEYLSEVDEHIKITDEVSLILIHEVARYKQMYLFVEPELACVKDYAIQNFAMCLLDVVDDIQRAYESVKESFSSIDASKDTIRAVPLLKTLLEGVAMSNKQLGEIFEGFGVKTFNPINERFNPQWHKAVSQVQDDSKPPGIVADVLKCGYTYRCRNKDVKVIRAAEVAVTQAVLKKEAVLKLGGNSTNLKLIV